MILALGLDSQFAMTETVTSAVLDQWPALRPRQVHCIALCYNMVSWQPALVAITCTLCCLAGLPFCLEVGLVLLVSCR